MSVLNKIKESVQCLAVMGLSGCSNSVPVNQELQIIEQRIVNEANAEKSKMIASLTDNMSPGVQKPKPEIIFKTHVNGDKSLANSVARLDDLYSNNSCTVNYFINNNDFSPDLLMESQYLTSEQKNMYYSLTANHELTHCYDILGEDALSINFNNPASKKAFNDLTDNYLLDQNINYASNSSHLLSLQELKLEGVAEAFSAISLINSEDSVDDVKKTLQARAVGQYNRRVDKLTNAKQTGGEIGHATSSISLYFSTDEGIEMAKSVGNDPLKKMELAQEVSHENLFGVLNSNADLKKSLSSSSYWNSLIAAGFQENLKNKPIHSNSANRLQELNSIYNEDKKQMNPLYSKMKPVFEGGFNGDFSKASIDDNLNPTNLKKVQDMTRSLPYVLPSDAANVDLVKRGISEEISNVTNNPKFNLKFEGDLFNDLSSVVKDLKESKLAEGLKNKAKENIKKEVKAAVMGKMVPDWAKFG